MLYFYPKLIQLFCLVVLGRIVVHLLKEERREELELEKLWTLGAEHDDQFRFATKEQHAVKLIK